MTTVKELELDLIPASPVENDDKQLSLSPPLLNRIHSSEEDGPKNHRDNLSEGHKGKDNSPRYGWCSITPEFIQFLVNKKAFLFVFCVTCVLQGTFHTYFVAVITTLEKLFSIPSQVTGTLMMGSEIGQVSSALFLPYFVGQGHRPRWMAIGSSLFSLATLLCASPHILIPLSLKLKSTQDSQFCDIPSTAANTSSLLYGNETVLLPAICAPEQEQNPHFILFPIILLSLFTIGLGQTAVYTLGIPFLDDNVASRDSPIYFSITIGVRILGPVLGFILGSLCTRLYIYPHITPDYDPTDPRWLGAWWLGMLLISSCLFLTSIIMYGFPATLSRRKSPNQNGTEEETKPINSIGSKQKDQSSPPTTVQQPKLRNFPRTLKRLLSNKILILRTFSCVFHLLPISGLYTFLPKYLESQFRLAAFQANMVTGIAGILVMGIGIFSSGIFIRRREPSARGIAIWVAGAAGIYSAGMVALMFVGCGAVEGGIQMEGVSHSEKVSLSDFSLRGDGNFGLPNCETGKCGKCSESIYSPVCGSDNLVYFSPCHAGCSEGDTVETAVTREGGGGGKAFKVTYTNCTCIGASSPLRNVQNNDNGPNSTMRMTTTEQTATNGMCPVSCDLFPLYLTIFMIIVLVHSTSEVGSMLLTLRCVEPRDKAMALGLIQCAIGIFGNVPCPVIYGTVVDSACIVWGLSGGGECGESSKRGHCWVYDSSSFRIYFHGTTAFLMFIAFVIDIVIVFHADAINIGTTEVEKQEEENEDSQHHTVNNLNSVVQTSPPVASDPNKQSPGPTSPVHVNQSGKDAHRDDGIPNNTTVSSSTSNNKQLLESSPLLSTDDSKARMNGTIIVPSINNPSS